MVELTPETFDDVRDLLRPRWDGNVASRQLAIVHARRARRERNKRAVFAATVAGCVVLAFSQLWPQQGPQPAATVARAVPAEPAMVLDDGTRVLDHLDVEIIHSTARETLMRMRGGVSTFDVVPNLERRFAVQAKDVSIIVLGTRFRVDASGDRVSVEVEHGTVRVEQAGKVAVLVDGQTWEAAPSAPGATVAEAKTVAPAKTLAPTKAARSDDVIEAALERASGLRTHGRYREAARVLREIYVNHPADARAPLAAFAAGRLALDHLHDQAAAKAAFAACLKLAPDGPLAEDARTRLESMR